MQVSANFASTSEPTGGLSAAADPAPYSPPALTPELLAELEASAALMKQKIEAASDPNRNAAFDKYVADQAAKGVEVASTYTGGGGPLGSGGVLGVTDFAPAFDPANPAGTTGQVVRFDEGKMNAPVVFQPGQQYVLTDASGEKVVGRASSVEELQKLADAQGNMPYGFQLYQADDQGNYKPGTQLFGQSDPRVGGVMGLALEYGLPLATAFIPGLGQLGLLAQMGIAGGASGFGNLMAGNTPEKALTSALISAGTAGLLKGTPIGETINKAVGSVIPGLSSVAEKGGSALAQKSVEALAPGALEVVGQRLGSSLVSNLATGALSAAGGSLLGDVGKSLVQPDQFQQAVGSRTIAKYKVSRGLDRDLFFDCEPLSERDEGRTIQIAAADLSSIGGRSVAGRYFTPLKEPLFGKVDAIFSHQTIGSQLSPGDRDQPILRLDHLFLA
jgi:hypothetical protein